MQCILLIAYGPLKTNPTPRIHSRQWLPVKEIEVVMLPLAGLGLRRGPPDWLPAQAQTMWS